MNDFTSNIIKDGTEYISAKLKQARQEQGLSLKKIAQELNINREYLEAFESGDYSCLPQGLYGRSFLREYAVYLKLDHKKLIQIYEDEFGQTSQKTKNDPFSHKKPRILFFLSVPKIIRNTIIIIIILVCLSYLAYYINNIISPPKLNIYYPQNDITVNENTITIQGRTEPEAKLSVNGEVVLLDADGFFTTVINLKTGLNNIQISAQKKYSQQNLIVRKIFWQNPGL